MPKVFPFLVMPNPYCHIDQRGWLGGAVNVAENPRRSNQYPTRAFVSARIDALPGTHTLGDPDETGMPIREKGQPLQSRAEHAWTFGGPVEINVTPEQMDYYRHRFADGTLFRLQMPKPGEEAEVPLEALAEARLDAIAQYAARRREEDPEELPFDVWAKQFPFDEAVAQVAEVIAAEREAEAKKTADAAAAEAKLRAEEAKQPTAADRAKLRVSEVLERRKADREEAARLEAEAQKAARIEAERRKVTPRAPAPLTPEKPPATEKKAAGSLEKKEG